MIGKIHANSELWNIFIKEEEYEPAFSDRYGRFPYYLSKHRNVMEPVVSRHLMENGFQPEYPDGKKFAVCLTHDIDVIKEPLKICAYNSASSLIRKDLKNAIHSSFYNLNNTINPYRSFKQIIELEKKYSAKSSFYFLALRPGERDYNYSLETIAREIRYISDEGWEVGLHGGHGSYKNIDEMIQQKKMLERILGKEVIGYRNHYLRFKTPDTWELLSKAGFKYDTTYGYSDCVGFRNGMCHPFKPFNMNTGEGINILEIPLVIMDCTLSKDMRLNHEGAWQLTKQLIDTVEQYRGVITVLWHNTNMEGEDLELYESILKYCSGKNAWMTSAADIFENSRFFFK